MADRRRTSIAISLIALIASLSRGDSGQTDAQAQDMAGIERLHQQDVAATLSGAKRRNVALRPSDVEHERVTAPQEIRPTRP